MASDSPRVPLEEPGCDRAYCTDERARLAREMLGHARRLHGLANWLSDLDQEYCAHAEDAQADLWAAFAGWDESLDEVWAEVSDACERWTGRSLPSS